jgi:transposase
VPVIPSWLVEPLWVQFAALLPERPVYDPGHPLGCHRRRVGDQTVFDKLLQVLRFGCSYEAVADSTCSASNAGTPREPASTRRTPRGVPAARVSGQQRTGTTISRPNPTTSLPVRSDGHRARRQREYAVRSAPFWLIRQISQLGKSHGPSQPHEDNGEFAVLRGCVVVVFVGR